MPPSIIQLQRELEDFPDEKLIQEAQQPTEYPAYLSTQELKRRAALREKYQAREAQVPQGTVAERQVQEAMQNMAPMGPMGGAQPPGMPPQGGPPQGGPPQGGPPQGGPPQGGPPPGMPPQGGPPQGMPPQGGPPPMAHGGIVGLQEGGQLSFDFEGPGRRSRIKDVLGMEEARLANKNPYFDPYDVWEKSRYREAHPVFGGDQMWEMDRDWGYSLDDMSPEEQRWSRRYDIDKHLKTGSSSRMGKLGRLGGKLIKGIGALGLGADLLMSPENLGAGTVPEPGRTAEERKALMDHTRSSMEEARSFGMASIEQPRSFSDILHGRAYGGIVGLDEGGEVPHPWHHDEEVSERISELEELNPYYDKYEANRYLYGDTDLSPTRMEMTPEYLEKENPEYAEMRRRQRWLAEDAGTRDVAAPISEIQERMRGLEGDYLRQRTTGGEETGLPSIADISGYSPEFGELSDKLSWYSGAGDEGPIWREKAVDAAQAVEDAVAEKEAAAAAAAAASASAVNRPPAEFDIEDHPLTAERMERMEAHDEWLRKPTDSEVAYESFLGDIAKQYRGRIPSDEQNLARERSEILDSLIAGFGATGRGGFSKAFREAGGTKDVWLERDRQKAEREKYEDAADAIIAKRHGIQTLRSRQNVTEKADTILADLQRELGANMRSTVSSSAAVQAAYQQVVAANLYRDPRQYDALQQQMYKLVIDKKMSQEIYDQLQSWMIRDMVQGMGGGEEPGVERTIRTPMVGLSQTGSNVGTTGS